MAAGWGQYVHSRSLTDRNPENPGHHNSELTFIILARTSGGELATSDIPNLPMIGDVNIFLNGTPGDQDFEAEAEIMIAGEFDPSEYLCFPSPAPQSSPHRS